MLFFCNAPTATWFYTLSLHDALPILGILLAGSRSGAASPSIIPGVGLQAVALFRSEEHTSELQSHHDLVCRLLLEKKKHIRIAHSRIFQIQSYEANIRW